MQTQKKESYYRDVLVRFFHHKLAVISTFVLLTIIIAVVILPIVCSMDPYSISADAGFGAAPSRAHPMGTDNTGRDQLARLFYGGRTSLMVGLFASALSALIGIPMGILAGYYRGKVETVIMRLSDVFQAFPGMILSLVLVAVVGPSLQSVIFVIGFQGWTSYARLMHSSVISTREKDYVQGAKAIGTKDGTLICRYILPNSFTPVLVQFSFGVAGAILAESSLSFLGLGIQIPQSSWGNMLSGAQSLTYLTSKPWLWVPPGMLLMVTVLCVNFVGDGLRDALDPKMKV